MYKKYFWDWFCETSKNYFNTWVLQEKEPFSLNSLYWDFFDINIYKIDENLKLENWIDKNNREKFLLYLSELLKNWEIKMAILFKEWRYPREDEYDNVPIVTPWELNFMDSYYKEYDVNNYKEWIDDLRSEWNREMTEDERRLFEDWNVYFALPENKFFILEWSWEKRN